MEEFEKLEFEKNLSNINSLETDTELIGREDEAKEILYRIISGNMLLIEGREGVGKTALLKYAIDNFKGKGKVIYVNVSKVSKRFNISDLLKKKSKEMILLVDNAQYLSKKNNERIKDYYDQDYIRSVIFTTTDYNLINFTDALKTRIGRSIIRLTNIDKDDALEIAKTRLDDEGMLPNDVLEQLYSDSNNLKEFLMNCDLLCGYLENKNKKKATRQDIKKVPNLKLEENINREREICSECEEELMKVGDYWRCSKCDQYCTICGALYEDDDEECPECGIKIMEDEE